MNNKVLSIIFIGIVLASCQKQQVFIPAMMDIQFIHPSAVTRATATEFESGDKIGLYVVETPAPLQVSGNYVNNLQATYNGSQWTGDSGLHWPSTESVCDVYAYYPYFESVTSISANPFSILEDQSAGYGPCDFLWGKVALKLFLWHSSTNCPR